MKMMVSNLVKVFSFLYALVLLITVTVLEIDGSFYLIHRTYSDNTKTIQPPSKLATILECYILCSRNEKCKTIGYSSDDRNNPYESGKCFLFETIPASNIKESSVEEILIFQELSTALTKVNDKKLSESSKDSTNYTENTTSETLKTQSSDITSIDNTPETPVITSKTQTSVITSVTRTPETTSITSKTQTSVTTSVTSTPETTGPTSETQTFDITSVTSTPYTTSITPKTQTSDATSVTSTPDTTSITTKTQTSDATSVTSTPDTTSITTKGPTLVYFNTSSIPITEVIKQKNCRDVYFNVSTFNNIYNIMLNDGREISVACRFSSQHGRILTNVVNLKSGENVLREGVPDLNEGFGTVNSTESYWLPLKDLSLLVNYRQVEGNLSLQARFRKYEGTKATYNRFLNYEYLNVSKDPPYKIEGVVEEQVVELSFKKCDNGYFWIYCTGNENGIFEGYLYYLGEQVEEMTLAIFELI